MKKPEPDDHEYELACYNSAKRYLTNPEIEQAVLTLTEYDMSPDEIKAASEIIQALESGGYD